MEPDAATPPQTPEERPLDPRVVWKWFRLVGLPLIAVIGIAGAILWLRMPDSGSGGVAVDAAAVDEAERSGTAAREGALAPDFALQTSDGTTYRLSDLRGRHVVLNFWATWCGPCRHEMPAFEEEHRARAAEGLAILAINMKEGPGLVDPFVKKLELTFPVLLDRSGSVSARYRVRVLPTTVFITPEGVVDGIRQGPYSRRQLSQRLDQFLEGE